MSSGASKVRLLLVDDRPSNLVDLEAILDTSVHDIVVVASVADAHRELAASDFAVIMVSAAMSAPGGHEVVAQLRPAARGPILLVKLAEIHTARARLQRADQLQQQFLASLGQELRAPLNTILGWIRMLRDGALSESRRGRALETIEQTATAQLEMIQEMIDISRMTSGTLSLELGSVHLAQMVQHVIEGMRPVAAEKLLTLHAAIDADVVPMSGDHERLRQVVHRLVQNAVDSTPTEGLVTVSLRNVGSQVELAITNTGTGIDAQVLPALFDPFVGDTLNARAGGGLGLALVRHLVELHSGTISADSPGPGLGSTFVVHLPVEGRTPRTDDEVR
ncbi:MAG: hypothetical protein H0T46_03015 [Deltaproteobacteria bacterium]|nr:hypothetical protein [Deltaproteobacteria bacterium]